MARSQRWIAEAGRGMVHSMRYAIYNHQSKALVYIDALDVEHEGVEIVHGQHSIPEVDFVMTDHDLWGRATHLEKLRKAGAKWIFIYPHAGRPNVVNDIVPAWEHTTANLVASEGQRKIFEKFGYPKPTHAVGWSLCPLREFQEREEARKILFAPIHPRCASVDQQANALAFEQLRELAVNNKILLTVRHIGELKGSGLEFVEHENIDYIPGTLEPCYEQIDDADVVVAHGTFLYLAVARGIPALAMGTDIPIHLVPLGKEPLYAEHWGDYAEMMVYPIDILQERDTLGMLQNAIEHNTDVVEWRERMIGEPFNGDRVREIIGRYMGIRR